MSVTIEPLSPEHFGTVAQWLSDPAINRWLTSEWRGRTIDAVLMGIVVRNKRNRLFLIRADNDLCGIAGLADIDPGDRVAMAWYALGDSRFGGRGVTTDAVRALVRYAFAEMNLASVYAWIMDDNVRSRRVLEKSGFRESGRLRSSTCSAGRQVDRVYFDITPADLNG